ncbi:MAG: hypothetical protein K2Q03_01595 [Sphingobacteriaceae bacterium]|nr:hypothetical protein [Sphingobacteriaceae bacterium]
MQNFNHIESLWAEHSVELKISADEMLKQVKKDVNHIKTKSILNILGMVASFLTINLVWIYIPAEYISTHIGMSIILITIGVYLGILYKHHRMISKTDYTMYPNQYLNTLKNYQLIRFKLYNRMFWIYTVFLSIGLLLYFIEIFEHFSFLQKTITLSFTFIWILYCSTILRTKVMNREKERINLLIEKLERISNQFKD